MEVSEKASVAPRKVPKRIILRFVPCCVALVTKKRKPKPWPPNNSPTLPQERFKFFATSPVPFVSLAKRLWSLAPV